MDEMMRAMTPDYLRVAGLIMLLLAMLIFAANPAMLLTNRALATLPLHRFKWATEIYLSSGFNRTASILLCTFSFGIFTYTHFLSGQVSLFEAEFWNFFALMLAVLFLYIFKLFSVLLFFELHEEQEIGTLIVDYQLAFNFILGLALMVVVCVDLYFLRLGSSFFIPVAILTGLLFLLRLMGSIMLLLNKFSFPVISLFVYLCAFEISPMLVLAKVILVKS